MVYTVTFSPALDYVLKLENLKQGEVNRAYEEGIVPGGKGINVSIILSNLGIKSKALGFIAGFTGEEIERRLSELGIERDFVKVPGMSRINVKLKTSVETDVNGIGAKITKSDFEEFCQKIRQINDGDFLVLAGSIPSGLPTDIYEQVLDRVKDKNLKIVVDATGDLLLKAVKFRPYFVKPNKAELEEVFKVKINNREELLCYAGKLREAGAQNVVVSMDSSGAVMLTSENEIIEIDAPKGKLVNSVGAGDSLVAGLIAGIAGGKSKAEALRLGVAAGSATAFSEWLASGEKIQQVLKTISE